MTYRSLPDTTRLKIDAATENGSGATRYEIKGYDASANPSWDGLNQHAVTLTLQHGPLSDGKPPNGVTVEALLAIVIDQLRSVQPAEPARSVLDYCETALKVLKEA